MALAAGVLTTNMPHTDRDATRVSRLPANNLVRVTVARSGKHVPEEEHYAFMKTLFKDCIDATLLLAEMRRHHDPWRLWDQPPGGLTPPPDTTPLRKSAKKERANP